MRRLDGKVVAKQRLALRASPRAEARYVKDLRAIAKGIVEATESAMQPEIEHRGTRTDVAAVSKHGQQVDAVIGGLRVHLARVVAPAFDRMSEEVSKKNAAGMRLLGIQPARLGLSPVVAAARDENIRLVENAGRSYAESVREVFDDAANFGLRVEELQELLEQRGEVFGSRAELIARDQTLKTNAALTKERHQQAGITRYTWSTSKDERVRPMHADLEGEDFDWDSPPVTNEAGDENHPGEDYQCRCVPLPVLDLGEEEETETEPETEPEAIGPLPSLDLDEHFEAVDVGRGATMTAEEVIADMQSEGVADWVKENKARLEVKRVLPRNNNGTWDPRGGIISIATDRQFSPGLVPGQSWSISHTRADAKAAARATFVHELGHHVHLTGSMTGEKEYRAAEKIVTDAYRKLDLGSFDVAAIQRGERATPAITRYATKNSDEYFAESFAAYHLEPEALKAHDPGGFKMVEEVLRLKGILK